jgi:hypothetical protein
MITIELMELIFGTPWATPEQCEAVAVLYGRQQFEKAQPCRELLEAVAEEKNIVHVAMRQIARSV